MLGWIIGAGVSLFILCFCYLISHRSESRLEATFTPRKRDRYGKFVGDEVVGYEDRHGHYLKTAELIVTLASASLLFIASSHLNVKAPFTAFGFPVVLLAFCVASGVTFMALVTYFYELFLFDPNTFTLRRSAWLTALGLMELLYFGVAYIGLAVQLILLSRHVCGTNGVTPSGNF
jgi:hypothetical protein